VLEEEQFIRDSMIFVLGSGKSYASSATVVVVEDPPSPFSSSQVLKIHPWIYFQDFLRIVVQ
jgi:hypothetical protein